MPRLSRSRPILLLLAAAAAMLSGCASTGGASGAATTLDPQAATFLMFQDGRAERAMEFYVSLFDDAEITGVRRYGPNETGPEGTVERGVFTIRGQRFMCTDSPISHDFTFTPSTSVFITCESNAELERLAASLSEGGETLMPLADYGFSQRFTWVVDRFGVSWQLNLP